MRPKGIEYKETYYLSRKYEDKKGSSFGYYVKKLFCVPEEELKYYLKIGGIVRAESIVIGNHKPSVKEWFFASEKCGSYVYYTSKSRILRVITIAKIEGKLFAITGQLNSVLPRHHMFEENVKELKIISCLVISNTISCRRYWTRFKDNRIGFHEIQNIDFYLETIDSSLSLEDKHKYGFYVGNNTSLIIIDETSKHLNQFKANRNTNTYKAINYTLIQSGGFIILKIPLSFKLYEIEETQEYSCLELYNYINSNDSMPNSQDLNEINSKFPVIFLENDISSPFWTLRIVSNDCNDKKEMCGQLCIPSNTQFHSIKSWKEGLKEVQNRQTSLPWSKYTTPESHSDFSDIDMEVSEAYPGINGQ